MSSNNGKKIEGVPVILSLEDARREAKGEAIKKDPEQLGAAGLKRPASKEFVLENATLIALGACRQTYEAMSTASSQQMATLESTLKQHMHEEFEARTLQGRLRRGMTWVWTLIYKGGQHGQ